MSEIEGTYLITYLGMAVDCSVYRSSHPEVFPGKGILKICSKFTTLLKSHFSMGALL